MPCGRTRREFLWQVGGGFAGLALIDLLSRDARAASVSPLAAKPPHFPAKAKHVVFLFMNGAPSQVDTFDPKPALTKFNGTPYNGELAGRLERPADRPSDAVAVRVHASTAQSGLEISSLFPHTAEVRRRPVRDPLDVHRHGRARLRLPADEHRQRAHRQAEPRLLAQLRPGHRRTRTCRASS